MALVAANEHVSVPGVATGARESVEQTTVVSLRELPSREGEKREADTQKKACGELTVTSPGRKPSRRQGEACGAGVDVAVLNPPCGLKTQEAEQQENPGPWALLGAGVWGKMVAPSWGAPSRHLSQAAGRGLEASGSVLSLGDEFRAHSGGGVLGDSARDSSRGSCRHGVTWGALF